MPVTDRYNTIASSTIHHMIRLSILLSLLLGPPVACFVVQQQKMPPQSTHALHETKPSSQKDPAKKGSFKSSNKNKGDRIGDAGGSQPNKPAKAKSTFPKSAYPAKQQEPVKQQSFSKNNANKGGDSQKPDNGNGGGGFSVRFVYSAYDLDVDDYESEPDTDLYEEETIKFKNDVTMKDVLRKLSETFGFEREEMDSLEYLLNGEWKPFNDPSALKGKQFVPIRNAATFDDGEDEWIGEDEWKGEDGGYGYNDDLSGPRLAKQIRDIVAELRKNGYIPAVATLQPRLQLRSRYGDLISTKDYVVSISMNDKALQEALVSNIGCLDHIAQAIHFPFLWTEADDGHGGVPSWYSDESVSDG
jgi:hypothetical protein